MEEGLSGEAIAGFTGKDEAMIADLLDSIQQKRAQTMANGSISSCIRSSLWTRLEATSRRKKRLKPIEHEFVQIKYTFQTRKNEWIKWLQVWIPTAEFP